MKRFTETAKWNDPWFRRLTPAAKLLWQWLLDHCDGAGVVEIDLELAGFQTGCEISEKTVAELGERVSLLDGGKYHLPKFIGFQYGELSNDCKAHRPVFQSLKKHGLERVSIGYPKGIHTLKEQDKAKDTEKDKGDCKGGMPELADAVIYGANTAQPPIGAECIEGWMDDRKRAGWKFSKQGQLHEIDDWRADLRIFARTWRNVQDDRRANGKSQPEPVKGLVKGW